MRWPYNERAEAAHAWGALGLGAVGLIGVPTVLATLHAADSRFRPWWPTNWMIVPLAIFAFGLFLLFVPVRRSQQPNPAAASPTPAAASPTPERLRAIVARMRSLSSDALAEWWRAGHARLDWIESIRADPSGRHMDTKARDEATEHWVAGSELFEKLRFELTQLDLIAGRDVRAVATTLVREHESVQHWTRPASGADDWYKLLTEQNNKIVRLHEELVDKTRAELGLDPTSR